MIEEALDNINYEEYFRNKVLVKSLKRKYWKKNKEKELDKIFSLSSFFVYNLFTKI